MKDKLDKAVEFFRKGRTGEKKETSGTSEIPLQAKPEIKERKKMSAFASRIREKKEKKADEMPLQINPEAKDKRAFEMPQALSLFAAGINKISEVVAALKSSKVKAAPIEPKAEECSIHRGGNVSDKEKAGWLSPKYSQSRTVHLDAGFLAENRCLAYLDNVPEAEAYRVLRTQVLQRTKGTGGNIIMVTSALPGEGKTLTAINLAFTFAREFQHTVLLVDGDLRKQSIHKYLGCAGEKGLIDYLVHDTPVSEIITYPGIEKMTLISGGASYKESAEILGSPRMKELVADMKGRYPERYVIFDVPPILTGADVLTLAPLMDQVIVVVLAGKTSMDDAGKALTFLPKEKILGFVLNRCCS